MSGARKGTSHKLLYNEVSWSTLEERRSWNKLTNFGKIVNHETPQYLQALLPNKVGDSRPASRYADNYILIKTRTESFKRSFIPSSVKLWNELPLEKRNTDHCRKMMKKDRNILYYEGPRSLNIKHIQLRMQCSKLNYHLFCSTSQTPLRVHVGIMLKMKIISCYIVPYFIFSDKKCFVLVQMMYLGMN